MKRVYNFLGILLTGAMMAEADKPESANEGDEEKSGKWISLAPAGGGMGSWKALNFGGEGETGGRGQGGALCDEDRRQRPKRQCEVGPFFNEFGG